MTQPSTTPALPAAPVGVPAWLTRLVALLVAGAGPTIAFVDPSATRFTPAVKAAIILGFLVVGFAIFIVHLVLSATHEYGWNLNAASHVATGLEAEVAQMWPEMKQSYTAAQPVLDQVKAVQPTIDSLRSTVAELEQRTSAAGLDPEAVVKALETATGMSFPRSGPAAGTPAATDPAPSATPVAPATTQAS